MVSRHAARTLLLVAILVAGAFGGLTGAAWATPSGTAASAHPALPASSPPLTGSVHGPTLVLPNATNVYTVNATGGPAVAANGTRVGNLTFYASLASANTTGVKVSPTFGGLTGNSSYSIFLTVGPVAQTVTLTVEFASVYQHQNVSINLTTVIQVVRPFQLTGEVVASATTVLPFSIQVALDGTIVGSVSVPTLTPHEFYNFTYQYLTAGLASGYHTFTLTLPQQNGQVRFANGAISYSVTFYIAGPAPNYTLYYLLGGVAFVGVILIFLILVGARRRAGGR